MLSVRRLAVLLLLTGFVSTVVSCPVGRYKYYSYADLEEKKDFGVVRARLMGTYRKASEVETVLSSPYRLVVSVERPLAQIDSGKPCVLHIDEIIMTALDTREIVFSSRNVSEPFISVGDNKHEIAGLDRELPDIQYVDYDLAFAISITGCESEISSRNYKFVMRTAYTEGEETFWDHFRNL